MREWLDSPPISPPGAPVAHNAVAAAPAAMVSLIKSRRVSESGSFILDAAEMMRTVQRVRESFVWRGAFSPPQSGNTASGRETICPQP